MNGTWYWNPGWGVDPCDNMSQGWERNRFANGFVYVLQGKREIIKAHGNVLQLHTHPLISKSWWSILSKFRWNIYISPCVIDPTYPFHSHHVYLFTDMLWKLSQSVRGCLVHCIGEFSRMIYKYIISCLLWFYVPVEHLLFTHEPCQSKRHFSTSSMEPGKIMGWTLPWVEVPHPAPIRCNGVASLQIKSMDSESIWMFPKIGVPQNGWFIYGLYWKPY